MLVVTTRFLRNLYGRSRWRVGLLLLFCSVLFLANNELIEADIMECRNLVTAREMVVNHHWLLPTMNGEPRIEKPPLPTWLAALAYYLSPSGTALPRTISALAALLLLYYAYRLARDVLRIPAEVAVVFLATSVSFWLMARTATWDIFTHAFMMGGIYHWAMGMTRSGRSGYRDFFLSGCWMGLSVMSKGPVSLYALFLPFVISFGVVRRVEVRRTWKGLLLMLAVAAVVGGWWYAYLYGMEQETLQRVSAKESGNWFNHHVRPWYYYWKFFLESGVWSALLLTSLLLPLSRKTGIFRSALTAKSHPCARGWLMSAVWLLCILVLLSLLPEKKSRYLFPLLIPAAYCMSCLYGFWRRLPAGDRMGRAAFRWNVGLLLLVTVVLAGCLCYLFVPMVSEGLPGWSLVQAMLCLAATCAAGALLWQAAKRWRPRRMLAGVMVLFLGWSCFGLPLCRPWVNNPEKRSIATAAASAELSGVPFYHSADEPLRIELVYAAGREVRPLELCDSVALFSALPCGVLTHRPLETYLTPEVRLRLDIMPLGSFDDNARPRRSGRYKEDFLYCLTLVRSRTQE